MTADADESPRALLLVEWEDSWSGADGWKPLDGLGAAIVLCQSVGWLVSESAYAVTLVPHISGSRHAQEREFARGELTIPKKSIRRTVKLKEPK